MIIIFFFATSLIIYYDIIEKYKNLKNQNYKLILCYEIIFDKIKNKDDLINKYLDEINDKNILINKYKNKIKKLELLSLKK